MAALHAQSACQVLRLLNALGVRQSCVASTRSAVREPAYLIRCDGVVAFLSKPPRPAANHRHSDRGADPPQDVPPSATSRPATARSAACCSSGPSPHRLLLLELCCKIS